MKRLYCIAPILLVMFILPITSCAGSYITSSNHYITQPVTQKLATFEKITVPSSVDVEFTTGTRQQLSIYGADNVIPYVTLTVSNKTLTVGIKPNVSIQGKAKLKVLIESPRLTVIRTTGSGDVEVRGLNTTLRNIEICGSGDVKTDQLQTQSLTVSITGSGDLEIRELKAGAVNVKASGSGDVELNGIAEKAVFTVNGSGDIDAEGLIVRNLTVQANGSGDIECYADVSLNASVNGSGDIEYRGNPQTINLSGRKSSIHRKY